MKENDIEFFLLVSKIFFFLGCFGKQEMVPFFYHSFIIEISTLFNCRNYTKRESFPSEYKREHCLQFSGTVLSLLHTTERKTCIKH